MTPREYMRIHATHVVASNELYAEDLVVGCGTERLSKVDALKHYSPWPVQAAKVQALNREHLYFLVVRKEPETNEWGEVSL